MKEKWEMGSSLGEGRGPRGAVCKRGGHGEQSVKEWGPQGAVYERRRSPVDQSVREPWKQSLKEEAMARSL